MLHLQMEEMQGEYRFKLSHHRLRRFSDWARAAFEAAIGLLAVAVVAGLGLMIWNAARSDGLVLDSFAVPPDLAAKGYSGEVLATQLLDKLDMMEESNGLQTRPGRALSGGWGDDVKVEIPETGVSLGELYRFLRRWLGHEVHVSGDVVHTPDGVAVNVRIDGRNGAAFAGPEAQLGGLMLKAAEHVMDVADPARYAVYLMAVPPPRVAEARAVLERAANDPTLRAIDRAAALNDFAVFDRRFGADDFGAEKLYRQALAVIPDYPVPQANLASEEQVLGRVETAYAATSVALSDYARHAGDYYPQIVTDITARTRTIQAQLLGDDLEMERQARIALGDGRAVTQDLNRRVIALALAARHDGGAARDWLARMPQVTQPLDASQRPLNRLQVDMALEQWAQVIAIEPVAEKIMGEGAPYHFDAATFSARQMRPWLALAKAKTGDIAGAESLIAAAPGDCYDCVRVRGLIAAEARQWGRADFWFARAVQDAPSIPFAYEGWGRSLLARGDAAGAIAKFKLANQKGPHFADPLEGWGEALMAQNRSDLALAKFQDAEQYAPNWGRLHLKWGEALGYAGKKDEAQKQFAIAAALDLTAADKAELAKANHG